ncbi:MAG: hypothetical protein ACRCT8_10695 [Lacipirellulaceae bacterium]
MNDGAPLDGTFDDPRWRDTAPSEARALLGEWFSGTIADADVARLNALLASNPAVRNEYLAYAAVEAELHAVNATDPVAGRTDRVGPRLLSADFGSDGRQPTLPRAFGGRGWLPLAAALVGVAAASSFVTRLAFAPAGATVAGAEASIDEVVARVTATQNCRWSARDAAIGFGTRLIAGQRIELVDGLAEITFDNGSRVLLEGPAVLGLEGSAVGRGTSNRHGAIGFRGGEEGVASKDAVLLSGRLAATAPAGIVAAPVRTARISVELDSAEGGLGTHFGLSADGHGGDEVHVFRGALDARLAENLTHPVRLESTEAARVRPASNTVAKFFANDDQFVRSIESTGGPQDGLYGYEGFDYPGGPLSGQNGGFGWAGAWADIEAALPPGKIATNVVEEGSLAYGDLRAIGSHAAQRAQQNRIRRALGTSLGGVFDAAGLVENQDGLRLVGANGKVVYLSFLQRVDRRDDGFYGFELHRGDGNGNRVLCVGNGAEGAGYGATSNYNAYGKGNYARLGKEAVGVNFFVVKIEFGTQNLDLVTVYRNPISLLDEPAVDGSAVVGSARGGDPRGVWVGGVRIADAVARLRGNFAFDRISLGNFDGSKRHEVDELRVGTTYRAVTGRRDRGASLVGSPVAVLTEKQHTLLVALATVGTR